MVAARLDVQSLAENAWRLTPDRLAAHVTRDEPIVAGFGTEQFNLSGPYQRPRHVRYLGAKIAKTIAKGNGRLIINLPPQIGKSLLCSKWTPTWAQYITQGRARVLLGSYESHFAASWGRAVRDVIGKYGDELLLDVTKDTAASSEWTTTSGGGMQTAGVASGLTGKAGDVIVIDDAFKDFKAAHSPTVRKDVWDWFTSVPMTRIQPGSTVIVVQTRWHEDDLVGRLITNPGYEEWELVRIPALADSDDDPLGRQIGEAIWPERFDSPHYAKTKLQLGAYKFAGMFQQLPAPLEGEMFKRGLWQYADAAPHDMILVRGWDLAGTEGDGDYTVGVLMGVTSSQQIFVLDVQRDQLSPLGVEQLIKSTAVDDHERYGGKVRIRLEQEGGSAGKTVAENYVKRTLQGFPADAKTSTGDKTLRAMPFAAQQEAQNVYLVRQLVGSTFHVPAWKDEYVEEHSVFPQGGHDDQVDASAVAFNYLMDLLGQRSKVRVARQPSAPLRPAGPSGRR